MRVFVNNVELIKPLKSLANSNGIFEYDAQLAPLYSPSVTKNIQSQALVPQQRIRSDTAEKLKG